MGAFDTIADKAAEKIAQKVAAPEKKPLPQDPTQAAIAQSNVDKNGQMPLPLTPGQAATMGLSGSDVPVPVAEAQMNTLERTGHVVPSSTDTPPDAPPAQSAPQPVAPEIQQVPMVAKAAPTTKEMIANIMGHTGPEGEMVVPAGEKKDEGVDWVKMLQGAGSGLGDFLQRWGLGLQGKGDAQTQGDIKRAQEFELKRQATANDLGQRNMAIDNTYQQQRMAIMQDYNKANLTQQEKAQRDTALATLDRQYQNEKALLPAKVAAERAQAQYQNSTNAASPNPAVATILKGR